VRISFDIDDTLVCDPSVPTELFVPWWKRWWYPELLRHGTRNLMRELVTGQHELWIYTTSYRPQRYLRRWFASFGIPIAEVVNQQWHEEVVGRQGPSKYPPAFGIDLHVDDSAGVAEEGRIHRFRVVVVSPGDREWADKVLAAVLKWQIAN
jgi:FMN phosphatase YigB (HAD superfamily)